MDVSYLSLAGKVALVTGASRGIGKATALVFADAGADVIITGRKLPALAEVAGEIAALGRRALPIQAHNREPEEIRRMVATAQEAFGRIDILVNNAAANPALGPIVDTEEKIYDLIMNTNLKGYYLTSQLVSKLMIARGEGGNIVNISSVGGVSPDAGLGTYCISKAGINMLTRALAVELGSYNIRVNALAPGVVQTKFSEALWANEPLMAEEMKHTPLKRIAQPEEVARTALWLVSGAAAYVTGQVIVMDGGGSV